MLEENVLSLNPHSPCRDTVDEFGGVESSRPPDIDTPDIIT